MTSVVVPSSTEAEPGAEAAVEEPGKSAELGLVVMEVLLIASVGVGELLEAGFGVGIGVGVDVRVTVDTVLNTDVTCDPPEVMVVVKG